jgi:hypothetical protein
VERIDIYLAKDELDALRKAAASSGRSVADLVREAIRKVVLTTAPTGPVALWDGQPRRTAAEHDSLYERCRRGSRG